MLRTRVYIGQVDVADYGVATRGDFEPLVSEKVFYRVQAILDGRFEITAPRQRNAPTSHSGVTSAARRAANA